MMQNNGHIELLISNNVLNSILTTNLLQFLEGVIRLKNKKIKIPDLDFKLIHEVAITMCSFKINAHWTFILSNNGKFPLFLLYVSKLFCEPFRSQNIAYNSYGGILVSSFFFKHVYYEIFFTKGDFSRTRL